MNGADMWLIAALVGLIVIAGVLGAAEAALLRVQRVRLAVAADSGDRRSATMVALLDDLPRVLNTVLLVVLLVQIGAATISGVLASRLFGSVGVTIASFVLTLVLFVYSEAIPKTYAVHHPESVARATAPILRFLSTLLRPLVSILVRFADLQAPGTGIVSPSGPTEDELLRLAEDAVSIGTIDAADHHLMDRAFDLGDQRVDDIYVPRLDVVALRGDLSAREALGVAIDSGHRRLPVYEDDIDSIVGVVRMRDLARTAIETPDKAIALIVNEPLFVPESKNVIELLGDMQATHNHFAVAVDEFGGTAGIVTIEDISQRLMGTISAEEATATSGIMQVSPTTWTVHGTIDTDEVERVIGVSLPRGEWTTIGGLITGVSGRFPEPGDDVITDELLFTVLETSRHRILKVQIARR